MLKSYDRVSVLSLQETMGQDKERKEYAPIIDGYISRINAGLVPIETLMENISGGRGLPDVKAQFLRIRQAYPSIKAAMGSSKVFISYRRADSAYATDRIFERLENELGQGEILMDIESIAASQDFRVALDNALKKCSVLLVIIGSQWLGAWDGNVKQRRLDNPADYVRMEIEAAISRNVPVIPVLIDESVLPPAGELPKSIESLVYRQAMNVGRGPRFYEDIERLIGAIKCYMEEPREIPTQV